MNNPTETHGASILLLGIVLFLIYLSDTGALAAVRGSLAGSTSAASATPTAANSTTFQGTFGNGVNGTLPGVSVNGTAIPVVPFNGSYGIEKIQGGTWPNGYAPGPVGN